MRTFVIILLAFFIGYGYSAIRMTNDKTTEFTLKLKKVSDGSVLFVPEDDSKPYEVGDLFRESHDEGLTTVEEKFIVIGKIKVK